MGRLSHTRKWWTATLSYIAGDSQRGTGTRPPGGGTLWRAGSGPSAGWAVAEVGLDRAGGLQQSRQEVGEHGVRADPARVGGDVECGLRLAPGIPDGYGDGPQAVLQLLVGQRVALLAHLAEDLPQLVGGPDRP